MTTLFIFLVGTAIFAAFATIVADWRWPVAPRRRVTLLCGLAAPLALLLLYPIALIWIWATPSGGVDADGMTIIVIGMMVAFGSLFASLIGLPTSIITLRYLRRSR